MKENFQMENGMVKEENIVKENQIMKENIKIIKEMEKEKNMIIMVH